MSVQSFIKVHQSFIECSPSTFSCLRLTLSIHIADTDGLRPDVDGAVLVRGRNRARDEEGIRPLGIVGNSEHR